MPHATSRPRNACHRTQNLAPVPSNALTVPRSTPERTSSLIHIQVRQTLFNVLPLCGGKNSTQRIFCMGSASTNTDAQAARGRGLGSPHPAFNITAKGCALHAARRFPAFVGFHGITPVSSFLCTSRHSISLSPKF